jgi:adenylate cyclase
MLQKVLSSRIASVGIGFAVVGCFLFLFLLQAGLHTSSNESIKRALVFEWLTLADYFDYDFQLRMRAIPPVNDKVAVIEINEPTLAKIGRFPFSRGVYATLIHKLREAGSAVLGFDMVFAEPEVLANKNYVLETVSRLAGKEISDQLNSEILRHSPDRMLAAELSQSKPKVVLGYAFEGASFDAKQMDASSFQNVLNRGAIGLDTNITIDQPDYSRSPVLPLSTFFMDSNNQENRYTKIGYFNVSPDNDGVIRQAQAILPFAKSIFGFLPIKVIEEYLGASAILDLNQGEIKFQGTRYTVPIDPKGRVNFLYYGPARTIPTYELIDVLEGRVGARELGGKILFLGASAVGLKDIRSTPYDTSYPGVETHATLVSNILEQQFVERGSFHTLFGLLAILIGGALTIFFTQRFTPLVAFFNTALFIAAYFFTARYSLHQGQWIPVVLPFACVMATFASVAMFRFLQMDNEKKFLRSAFSRYVSQSIVTEILKNPESLKLSGENRTLTVLFADVRGFTSLSEKMDAKQVALLLNDFFNAMTEVVLEHNGTVDKFMGDALMCFWGAPLPFEQHAKAACETALAMQEKLKNKNLEWSRQNHAILGMRIGINTGSMAVGNMGSQTIFNYTVVGDQVNLASRLESANAEYGTDILVGENTANLLQQDFVFRRVDEKQVRGRSQDVVIFELVGKRPQTQRVMDWIETYERGLQDYKAGKWDQAEQSLQMSLKIRPEDQAILRLLEKIQENKDPHSKVKRNLA